jgi:zinc transporter 2
LQVAISAHLAIDKDANSQRILHEASLMLERAFGVYESTIQIEIFDTSVDNECIKCEPVIA